MSLPKLMTHTLLAGLVLTGCGGPPRTAPATPSTAPAASSSLGSAELAAEELVARGFVEELAGSTWSHPKSTFTTELAKAMPPDQVKDFWQKVLAAGGAYKSMKSTRATFKPSSPASVDVLCIFERSEKTIRIAVTNKREIAGVFWSPSRDRLESRTRTLIEKSHAGDFLGASVNFAPVMKNALPPAKLETTWKALEEKAGPLKGIESFALKAADGAWFSLATVQFEKTKLVVKVVYDDHDDVVGLFIETSPVAWSAPPYVRSEAFTESEVAVGDKPALPGTLSIPKGEAAMPAVVLVHGSGPSDRDESVGAVRVFKDVAGGLASRGVAVLRYEKRSRFAPAGIVTEQEEVLDGVRDAVALLSKTPGVDPKRIYVIGHSQGGYLAPRIAKANPTVAGIAILAGPTRSLADLILDQLSYFAKLKPEKKELEQKIEGARAFKKHVEDPKLGPDDDVPFPLGGTMKGAYFLFQKGYDAAATARTLPIRIFVLQGDRDYQVTQKDLDGWKKTLAKAPRAKLKTYAGLNHLFVRGTGTPRPEDYEQPGHVDEEVITDLSNWLLETK